MKIITYSDIHLEFGSPLKAPECNAEILVLAGDIINFSNPKPLKTFLNGWNKPIIYVAGNHEYYNAYGDNFTMEELEKNFKAYIKRNFPNMTWLRDSFISIEMHDEIVHFFGGTMWTDFNHNNPIDMMTAHRGMNDYRNIYFRECDQLQPADTCYFHAVYKRELRSFLNSPLIGKKVVISHHCPGVNPASKYKDSELVAAFNSLDMIPIIEEFQPDLYIYGHTHECDDRMIGGTRIISNQSGYPKGRNRRTGEFIYETKGFDPTGKMVEI